MIGELKLVFTDEGDTTGCSVQVSLEHVGLMDKAIILRQVKKAIELDKEQEQLIDLMEKTGFVDYAVGTIPAEKDAEGHIRPKDMPDFEGTLKGLDVLLASLFGFGGGGADL